MPAYPCLRATVVFAVEQLSVFVGDAVGVFHTNTTLEACPEASL